MRILVALLSGGIFVFCVSCLIKVNQSSAMEAHVRQYLSLYDEIHRLATAKNNSTTTNTAMKPTSWPDYGQYKTRPTTLLGPTYGPMVTDVCDLTVLFLDPRLGDPHYGPGRSAWFALESVAAYAPATTTCVTLLTSSCTMQKYLEEETAAAPTAAAPSSSTRRDNAEKAARDKVYACTLPLFRGMIDNGLVRLSFVDHDEDVDNKYQLKSCNDYGDLHFLMNINFWKDEFTNLDSDSVLLIQDDAVLCHGLGGGAAAGGFLNQYKEYAYVGGVWPRHADPLRPFPPEGMCFGMPQRWKSWILPQRRWEKWVASVNATSGPGAITMGNDADNNAPPPPKPRQLLQTEFPALCDDGNAPIGNGGLSLRSRSWMIRAIETCPHVKHSGLLFDNIDSSSDTVSGNLACKVLDAIDEDYYFAVVLRGLGAPFPSAVEAALFAVEMIWPEELDKSPNNYIAVAPVDLDATERSRLLFDSFPRISNKGSSVDDLSSSSTLTVPYGLHKVWWYHSNELLLSSQMRESCPYLQYIFEPSMSRWQELHAENRWSGIGS